MNSPTRMRTQTKRAMSAPGLREAAMTKAVVLQDWMVPELSQPQMRMVRVPVLLSVGGPLSTTRMGRRNTSCSCRLKPTCCVCTAAVLSVRKKWGCVTQGWSRPRRSHILSLPRDLRLHTPNCCLSKDPHVCPFISPSSAPAAEILWLTEPLGVLSCPRIRFPAVLSVFSSILRCFAPSCAKVLFPANPRFCPQLGQGPGLGYANFFPH